MTHNNSVLVISKEMQNRIDFFNTLLKNIPIYYIYLGQSHAKAKIVETFASQTSIKFMVEWNNDKGKKILKPLGKSTCNILKVNDNPCIYTQWFICVKSKSTKQLSMKPFKLLFPTESRFVRKPGFSDWYYLYEEEFEIISSFLPMTTIDKMVSRSRKRSHSQISNLNSNSSPIPLKRPRLITPFDSKSTNITNNSNRKYSNSDTSSKSIKKFNNSIELSQDKSKYSLESSLEELEKDEEFIPKDSEEDEDFDYSELEFMEDYSTDDEIDLDDTSQLSSSIKDNEDGHTIKRLLILDSDSEDEDTDDEYKSDSLSNNKHNLIFENDIVSLENKEIVNNSITNHKSYINDGIIFKNQDTKSNSNTETIETNITNLLHKLLQPSTSKNSVENIQLNSNKDKNESSDLLSKLLESVNDIRKELKSENKKINELIECFQDQTQLLKEFFKIYKQNP